MIVREERLRECHGQEALPRKCFGALKKARYIVVIGRLRRGGSSCVVCKSTSLFLQLSCERGDEETEATSESCMEGAEPLNIVWGNWDCICMKW